MSGIVVVGGLLLVVLWLVYASIIKKRNRAREAWAGIDVQLKKRHDLIPNILAIAKRFMEHEADLLTQITELRAAAVEAGDPAQRLSAESALQEQMGKLMVAVEAYPELRSDQTMLNAQRTYSEVEANIAAARRFYNSAVTSLNDSVHIFPTSAIASAIGVDEMPLFEASETERAPALAADLLG